MTFIIIKIAAGLIAGFFAGPAAVRVFNRMPAKWLCDYGQEPSQELKDPYVKRVKENPWRWVWAAGFMCLCIRLSLADVGGAAEMSAVQLAAAGLFSCWLMLIIGLADLKYMIIPDQFVLLLALSAIGFAPFYRRGIAVEITGITGIWQPLLGMAIGGGFMLAAAGAGALIMKREAVGFGDVKLCAALGLVLGAAGITAVLICAMAASGVFAAAGLATGRYRRTDRLPMGPFICGSAAVYIFAALPILI